MHATILRRCRAHLHEGSKMPNLFGHAHIQYFIESACMMISYLYPELYYTLLLTAAYSHYASLSCDNYSVQLAITL